MASRYLSRLFGHAANRLAEKGYAVARRASDMPARSRNEHLALARLLARPDAVLIDLGANVGQFASHAYDAAPHATIFSVDPMPQNVEACKQRFAGKRNYRIVQAAVGDATSGDVTFNVHPYSQASSLLAPSATARDRFRSLNAQTVEIRVPLYSLDDLLAKEASFGRIDLLKVDVEGYESKVLAGAKRTLEKSAAVLVETQVQAMNEGVDLFDRVCQQAREAGFRFTQVLGDVRDFYGDLLMLDLLFERP